MLKSYLSNLIRRKFLGFFPHPLGEKMRAEQVNVNSCLHDGNSEEEKVLYLRLSHIELDRRNATSITLTPFLWINTII